MDDIDYMAEARASITADRPQEDAQAMVDVLLARGRITAAQHAELMDQIAAVCTPVTDLPADEDRISALESRCAALEELCVTHGWLTSETWPLVEGLKFTSADEIRHTGDRVAMLLIGEETVRHYVCTLNPTWEPKGTAYTPLGNAPSWWNATGKSEDKIRARLLQQVQRYPDFTGWVRPEVAALVTPAPDAAGDAQ